ncbi:RING-type domain-containing protein [Forsythia ovata]|uniref:RING-type domain-containing protein n=1 Tax=Forsythia ovata TaxID=205694 RepID=A0ABD1U7J6_9LAMI
MGYESKWNYVFRKSLSDSCPVTILSGAIIHEIADQIGRKSHSQPSTVKTAEQLGRKTYFYPPSIQSLVSQIDKQRLQIDQFVTLQNDRLRLALEEQRKQQISYFLKKSQVLIQQKDEEIIKAVNRAMELEEFVKL